MTTFSATRVHLSRLMKIWRSAGWPVRDGIELELLAANGVTLSVSTSAHETLRVTDTGLKLLAKSREHARRASSPHDRLARRMGTQLMESGRVVWRELSLRARYEVVSSSSPDAQRVLPIRKTLAYRIYVGFSPEEIAATMKSDLLRISKLIKDTSYAG